MRPPASQASPATTASYARYLLVFFATLLGIVAVAWIYVAAMPVAFMESGYCAWAAKSAMLDRCQLGQILFVGDSRLEAGVVPAALPLPATNLGLAAGTAVEARVATDRALACPTAPRQMVVSLVPEHFGPLSRFYWLLSVRYGFLSFGDVLAVRRLAAELGDTESLATPTPDGLSGAPRDWMYAARFPSLSFGSLVNGRLFGRDAGNRDRIAEVTAANGWAAYIGGEPVKPEHPDRFILTKLQNAELERTLAALRTRNIPAALLIMPFAGDHAETDETLDAYRDALAGLAARYGATLLDPTIPIWPRAAFADGAHLKPAAARAFTESLATCLRDGLLQAPCPLAPPPGL